MSSTSEPSGAGRRLRTLYVCYLPLSEPLVETQVVAYLRGIADAGFGVHLLTYEVERQDRATRRAIAERLAADGITWHRLRYHKRPSLPATVFDVVCGVAVSTWLVRRHRIGVVHARAHTPGAIALAVRRLTGAALLFDLRGLVGEEYVDVGIWTRRSAGYRLTTWTERRCLEAADAVVVLTDRLRRARWGERHETPTGAPIAVIPTCADVDAIVAAGTRRADVRRQLGVDHELVLVYVGKFTTWYLAAEVARFAGEAMRAEPSVVLVVLTQTDRRHIVEALEAAGVPLSRCHIRQVPPQEVGAWLGAADVAISFIAALPSKMASSPTKVGEYLAAGLPVVVSAGIGDTDELVESNGVGVVVRDHDPASHRAAFAAARELAGSSAVRARCVAVAQQELSLDGVAIPRYVRLYEHLERARAGS